MQWAIGMLLAAATAYVTTVLTLEHYTPPPAARPPAATAAGSASPDAPPPPTVPITTNRPPSSGTSSASSPGRRIRLKSLTPGPIPVARSRWALGRLADALEADGPSELAQLIEAGEVFLAAPGSPAELLEEETFCALIRVADGFGTPRCGYVISDSFQPQFIKLDEQ